MGVNVHIISTKILFFPLKYRLCLTFLLPMTSSLVKKGDFSFATGAKSYTFAL